MATGYVRQSAADIVSGEVVRAAPLNNEFNAIRDAFSTASGHNHDGTTGGGAYISTVSDSDNDTKVVADGATNSVQVSTAGTERMRVNSSGNVGIGRTPSYTLDVGGSMRSLVSGGGTLLLGDSQNTVAVRSIPGAGDSGLGFYTQALSANAERMRIDASGRLAINTADASIGSGQMVVHHSANNGLVVNTGGGASTLYLRNNVDATASKIMFMQGNGLTFTDQNNNERMRIDGSGTFNFNGNILTNIASPSSSADVVTKGYVDSAVALGGSLTADVNLSGFKITNMGTPTASADATTKSYVDTADTNNRNLTYYSLQVI